MRVLFLTHGYPPHALGGLTMQCEEVAVALHRRGHAVHVLTSRYTGGGSSASEDGIARSLRFQAGMEHYGLSDWLQRGMRDHHNLAALRGAIAAFQPDLVFVWGLWNLSRRLPYCAEQLVSPKRVAYAIADYWLLEPDMHGAYWQLPARRSAVERAKALVRPAVLRRLDSERHSQPLGLRYVTTCSQHVANRLAADGALPHGAKVIYNGIDPQPFLSASRREGGSGTMNLLYFGGLSEPKGVHTAIEALATLKAHGQVEGLRLTLVGGGHPSDVARLKDMVIAAQLEDRVEFRGNVARPAIPALLSEFDVFLFTSIWEEPFGRTIIEAMAAGLSVIGSAVGGSREIMQEGQNALLYPAGDARALANRLLELRDSPGLHQRLVDAGLETVLGRFTLDRMVDEMEAWLQSIVDQADVI